MRDLSFANAQWVGLDQVVQGAADRSEGVRDESTEQVLKDVVVEERQSTDASSQITIDLAFADTQWVGLDQVVQGIRGGGEGVGDQSAEEILEDVVVEEREDADTSSQFVFSASFADAQWVGFDQVVQGVADRAEGVGDESAEEILEDVVVQEREDADASGQFVFGAAFADTQWILSDELIEKVRHGAEGRRDQVGEQTGQEVVVDINASLQVSLC